MRAMLAVILTATILVASMPIDAQENLQQPPSVEAGGLARGLRVQVELQNGDLIVGVVGARFNDGLYIEQPTPIFVRYRDVRAFRNPDTGEIVGIPQPSRQDNRWVKRVAIAAV